MQRPQVAPEVLKAHIQVSTWKSLALCIVIYAAMVALAYLGGRASNWWGALPAIIVIAGLQNHLLILLHEGAHWLLHPDKKLNDLIADIFCAIPFFTLEKNYRMFHLTHHKFASSPERDPEVSFYRDQGYFYAKRDGLSVFKMLALDLLGPHLVVFTRSMNKWLEECRQKGQLEGPSGRDRMLNVVIWGGIGTASILYGFWMEVLVFWILPQVTFLFFFLKLHGYGEHTGATGPTEFERTWVHDFHPVENFFIYPICSGFHLEHHLFPRVPWYHMKQFRRQLMDNPEYRERSERVTVTSYFGRRSILRSMLWGRGEYRLDDLHAQTQEIAGDVIAEDTKREVDEQLPVLKDE